MEKRPLFRGYWAQDALERDLGDADVFVPTNPVYPEQVPEQYAAGWYVSPDDERVKQPHQWNNSWLQSVDWQLHNWYTKNFDWLSEVTYVQGAVSYYRGRRYVSLAEQKGFRPDINPTMWAEAAFQTKSEYEAGYKSVNDKYSNHASRRDNPHGVGYADVDGKSKKQIDDLVEAKQDDIDNHSSSKSNPHSLTFEQINALSKAAGGTFEGQVSLLRMILGGGGEIRRLESGFELFIAGGARLGIHTGTRQAQKDGSPLVTDVNYEVLRQRNAWKFSVPSPDVNMPLRSSIHGHNSMLGGVDYESTTAITFIDKSGVQQTVEPGQPGFGPLGLELRTGAGQMLGLPVAMRHAVGTVFGILDNVPVIGYGPLNKFNILEYFPAGTSLRDLKIWLAELTPYQIAALGVGK